MTNNADVCKMSQQPNQPSSLSLHLPSHLFIKKKSYFFTLSFFLFVMIYQFFSLTLRYSACRRANSTCICIDVCLLTVCCLCFFPIVLLFEYLYLFFHSFCFIPFHSIFYLLILPSKHAHNGLVIILYMDQQQL